MAIFVISDLHLSETVDKSMEVFGERWKDYTAKIKYNWTNTITQDDVVMVPGDVSWAINFDEFSNDLRFISNLPGTKIIGKGNHDYWWQTQSQLKKFLGEKQIQDCNFLFNNSFKFENTIICGTRGWLLPGDSDFKSDDEKILNRELGRLELSLESGIQKYVEGDQIFVMMHYPPYLAGKTQSAFVDLINKYPVRKCVFGHVHGSACENYFQGELEGVEYILTSADYLKFQPLEIG